MTGRTIAAFLAGLFTAAVVTVLIDWWLNGDDYYRGVQR